MFGGRVGQGYQKEMVHGGVFAPSMATRRIPRDDHEHGMEVVYDAHDMDMADIVRDGGYVLEGDACVGQIFQDLHQLPGVRVIDTDPFVKPAGVQELAVDTDPQPVMRSQGRSEDRAESGIDIVIRKSFVTVEHSAKCFSADDRS